MAEELVMPRLSDTMERGTIARWLKQEDAVANGNVLAEIDLRVLARKGMFRITRFAAIINPPEPAILAVGATQERPVVRDGQVVARPIMNLVLSCDHRATSGADGARLLDAIRQHLEEPLRLVL